MICCIQQICNRYAKCRCSHFIIMEGDMNDLSNKGLKRHKVGLLAVVGTIYSLTAAGAYGIEDMVPSVGPGLCMVMLIIIPLVWAYPQAFVCAEMGSIDGCHSAVNFLDDDVSCRSADYADNTE